MSDYSKLTVVNLRGLLKERGIPSTGLSRKQQFIERLEQDDREKAEAQATPAAPEQPEQSEEPEQPKESEESEPPAEFITTDAAAPTTAENAALEASSNAPAVAPAAPEPVTEAPQEEQLPAGPAQATESSILVESTSETVVEVLPSNDAPLPTAPEAPIPSLEPPGPQPIEDPISSAQVSDIEESRKRKRRSATPPVSEEEVANKKLKQNGDEAGAVHLAEDRVVEMKDIGTEEASRGEPQEPKQTSPAPAEQRETKVSEAEPQKEESDTTAPRDMGESPKAPAKNARYRQLFEAPEGPAPTTSVEHDEIEITAALHPATPAIYIRNLMRPLQPAALKNHLIRLATTPNADVESSDIIVRFHLDPIRTHALVLFSTPNQAARVRASLHDRVWPSERDRKPLWVDFVPDDKVNEWIELETSNETGGGRGAKRWEVVYETRDDGSVQAELREAGSRPQRGLSDVPDRRPSYADGPSRLSPRLDRTPSISTPAAPPQPKESGKSFLALDALFRSTTAKPKLYFLPVDEELVQKRLDEFDRTESRDWHKDDGPLDGPDGLRRYTFEDEDVLVDSGEHRPRFRDGPGGGFSRGRGRRGYPGGFRGR